MDVGSTMSSDLAFVILVEKYQMILTFDLASVFFLFFSLSCKVMSHVFLFVIYFVDFDSVISP